MIKFSTYALFLSIPFWHYKLAAYITFFEVGILVALIPNVIALSKRSIKFEQIDIMVVIYAIMGLVAVGISVNSFYEAARAYKYLVLVPVLLYYIIRFLPVSYETLRRAFYMMAVGVVMQTTIIIMFALKYRMRPVGDQWDSFFMSEWVSNIITYPILSCITICALYFMRKEVARKSHRIIIYMVIIYLMAGIVAIGTRMALLSFILLVPVTPWLWKKHNRRKFVPRLVYGIFMVMLFGILLASFTMTKSKVDHEAQQSLERVFNVDLYVKDLKHRLNFWNSRVRYAFESPIIGHGQASHTVSESDIGFHISSSHNVLVSSFVTSGIVGLTILLILIRLGYKNLFLIPYNDKQGEAIGKLILVSYTILILISLTNDLTAGRGALFMFLIALGARAAYESSRDSDSLGRKKKRSVAERDFSSIINVESKRILNKRM